MVLSEGACAAHYRYARIDTRRCIGMALRRHAQAGSTGMNDRIGRLRDVTIISHTWRRPAMA